MKILVVDDSELIRGYLGHALVHLGHESVCVSSACLAMERLVSDEVFDLLLIDVGLPGTDGVALAAQIADVGIEAPVIFITGNAGHPLLRATPASSILPKPFGLDELASALAQA